MSQWDYKIDQPMPGPFPFPNSRKGPGIEVVDELEVVANVNEADIICITEMWLAPDIPDSALSYSNFVLLEFCLIS